MNEGKKRKKSKRIVLFNAGALQRREKCPKHPGHYFVRHGNTVICPIGGTKCFEAVSQAGYHIPEERVRLTPGARF
jgi:hypothetical protein